MSYYTTPELQELGFASVGRNVRVSRKASLYGTERIWLGDDTRIDDFAVLSAGIGGIRIGRYVHVAVMCTLIGREHIALSDYANLSGRVSIYSATDDFSGDAMTAPTVPDAYTNVIAKPVHIGEHVVIGCGSVVLPGSTIGDGAAVGALSLVRGELEGFTIYAGIPARPIRKRATILLDLARRFEAGQGRS